MLECAVVVLQTVKTNMLPKLHACSVVVHDEDIALLNAFRNKCLQARLNQRSSDASLPVFPPDGEVTQYATPTFMPAQNDANDFRPIQCDEARLRIPQQI